MPTEVGKVQKYPTSATFSLTCKAWGHKQEGCQGHPASHNAGSVGQQF